MNVRGAGRGGARRRRSLPTGIDPALVEIERHAPARPDQLGDNIGALDVKLTPEHVAALDKASTPTLPFPVDMLSAVPAFAYGGTTINGQPSKVWAQAPKNDSERF